MGGGDGTIIIRNAMRGALKKPFVHGCLPEHMQAVVDPILKRRVDKWTREEHMIVAEAFHYAAKNCG